MKPLLAAALILSCAAPAVAAPVLVRSGEHGAFTRIVVDANPAADWRLDQDGRNVTLRMPQNREGFATSDVFRRITRDRVREIAADRQTLTLTLACDCVVTATPMAPKYIILDIAPGIPLDGTGNAGTPATEPPSPDWTESISATDSVFGLETPRAPAGAAETAATAQAEQTGTMPARIEPAPSEPAPEAVVLPLLQAPAERHPFDLGGAVTGREQSPHDNQNAVPDLQRTGDALSVLEDRLARQIGLAATQGLLKPAPDFRMEPESVGTDATPSDKYASEASLDPLLDQGGLPGNLRINSSIDVPDSSANSVGTTMDGLTCPGSDLFAVQDWGVEGAFGAEIARHRNALYGEFDDLDRAAQIALARAYVYYGFGAEALQIASLDVRAERTDAAITVIARLMEYGSGPRTDALVRFSECDSEVALWAMLADDGSGKPERMNTSAALRALNALPYHLRSFLAPELSKRLRGHGEGDAAAQAMRSLSRTSHPPESPARLEQAELDLAEGKDRKASAGFEAVIADNALEAPRALVRFIDLQVKNGEAISKDTALLAEAYAAEYRNSELAPEITRAHVMALAKSGQFDEAFKVMDAARGLGMVNGQLMSGIFETLQSDANDVTFLQRTMALTESDLSQVSQRARLDLGKRLVQLGFAAEAETIIADVDRDVAPRDQQLLRGRIHLALGHHRQALAAAGTFAGDEFEVLRADTLYATGEFEAAAAIYERLGQSDRAAAAAWNAPTGAAVALPENSSLTRATDIADRTAPQADGGLLARADALLSDSSALTADIESLLANPDLTVGPDS